MVPIGFDDGTGEKLVQQAVALRPLLVRNASRNEKLGRLTDEVVDALLDLDAWKMAAPRRWGGLALSLNAIARVSAELAKGCPSTGWVVGLMNSALWVGTLLPDHLQEVIFADGIPRMCNVGSPKPARAVDGGYLLDGRWDYASGCHHAEWAQLMVIVPGEQPTPGIALVSMADVSIDVTWNVTGLRGTGSDTVVAKNLFVPSDRVHLLTGPLGHREPGQRHVGEPSDVWPNLPALKAKALGVLVGIAEGLVESVAQGAKNRPILFTSYGRRSDSAVFQAAIGEAAAKVAVARSIMERSTSELDQAAIAGTQMDTAARAAARGQSSVAAELLLDVTTKIMNSAGSSAFNTLNPAQRYWRDLNIAARHGLIVPEIGYEILGRELLGVEPNIAPAEMY